MRATHLVTAALLLGTAACTVVTTATPPPEEDARVRLERGLTAADAGEFRTAFDHFAWVYTRCAGHERALEALAGLSAIELDPRNRAGRPGVGAELLGRLITEPGTPAWLRALSETSYLMALALGAPEPATATPAAMRTEDPADPDDPADALADSTPEAVATEPGEGVRAPTAAAVLDHVGGGPAHGCGRALEEEEVVEEEEEWVAPSLPTLPGPSLLTLLSRTEAARDSATDQLQALNAELTALRQRLQETEQELERIRRTLRP